MAETAKEIIQVNLEDEMRKSYLDYAMSVIEIAALHFIDDGNWLDARRVRPAIAWIGQITQNLPAG
jgi:DNA gyrase subunit A